MDKKKSEKSRNTWGQGVVAGSSLSSCVMLPHNVAESLSLSLSVCVYVCGCIDDRVEICSHVTFKFVGKSSQQSAGNRSEKLREETPATAAACCLLPFRAFHAFASKQELHDFLVIFRQAASCSAPPLSPSCSSSCLINLECLFNFVCSIAAFFVLICRQKNCSNRFTIFRFFPAGKNPL